MTTNWGEERPSTPQDKPSNELTAPSETEAPITTPTYAAAFRCIGPACEDTCCHDWTIPLDKKTYQMYAQFPEARLGSLVATSVSVTPDAPEGLYARIELAPSGFCPFFTPEQFCGIQKEYGPQALSATCSIYPRTLNLVNGMLEGSLALSCPEAARNILLAPGSIEARGNLLSGAFRIDNSARLPANAPADAYKPYHAFHSVRAQLIKMVRDRTRPIWQRLILIGSLCKRLDGITAEQEELTPGILNDYRLIRGDASVESQLETLPVDTRKRLDVFLRLTNERMQEKRSGKRFMDTFWDFIEGIGTPADAMSGSRPAPDDDVLRFQMAAERYHRPFFEARPYVLENYLLNYMFQNLFPFGREGSPHFAKQGIFDEYVLMVTLFAWVDTLLVGIAGRYKEGFSEEHVIKTVQCFCRAVEHFPYVLVSIGDYVRGQQLDSLQGMSILLR